MAKIELLDMGAGYLLFAFLHFLMFIFAITTIGLYGTDLNRSKEHDDIAADSRWVYTAIVAGLSALTSLLYFIPFFLRFTYIWVWNFVLFVLWIVVFGIFAGVYLKMDASGDSDIQRMKNAIWIDLINALLWMFGGLAALAYWTKHRERSSRFQGRAVI